MGWLYGNTIVDTNNSIETPSYQYDRIFSNYYLAQKTQTSDNVFLGRKILIDYNQPLEDTLTRIEPRAEGGYYFWREDSKYTFEYDIVTTDSMPKGTIAYMVKTVEIDGESKNITCLLECTGETSVNNINIATFVDVTDDVIGEDGTITKTSPFKIGNKTYNDFNKIFEYNQKLDAQYGSYDSTVWQKVYIGDKVKYIMIAELNAKNPTFDLHIKPPENNGLASTPVINTLSNDKYNLILSTQPGFRVNTQPYVAINVYRPGLFYYKEEQEKKLDSNETFTPDREYYFDENCTVGIGKFYYNYEAGKFYYRRDNEYILDEDSNSLKDSKNTSYYIKCSDTQAIQSYYADNNSIVNSNEKEPVAIYYNREGFKKDTRSIVNTNAIPDSITVKMDGYSKYPYDTFEYYEPIKNMTQEKYQSINSKNLYYTPENGAGYYEDDGNFDSTRDYFYLKNSRTEPDINQLSIYLPSIGNMVSEGWDKLYGEERNLNQYDYDYDTNEYEHTVENPNLKPDNLTGLYNLMVREVARLKRYDENFSATILDNIAKSVPLQMSTDENGFKRVIELGNAQTLQSQIAATNVSVQNIAKCVGLEIPSDQYKEVLNVTQDSYTPGVYYIKTDDNKYDLDTSEQFSSTKKYYTCRALQIKLADDETVNLQDQINQNQAKNDINTTNLTNRLTDIKAIAGLVGIEYNENADENDNITSLSDLKLTNGNKNSLTNQIDSNDKDIAQLMKNIGLSRKPDADGEDSIEKLNNPLINQITYNDYDIAKLAERIKKIEEFLLDGHFLFTFGRKIKEYNAEELPPIPGETNYDETAAYEVE